MEGNDLLGKGELKRGIHIERRKLVRSIRQRIFYEALRLRYFLVSFALI